MEKYDIIIIGAGIGGLAAGNILAKNGMKVLILEKNPVPGGAVSTFYRNGYPIDISHALCGLREGAFIRRIFDYLGIYNKLEFVELEKAFIYLDYQNRPIFCYTDFSRYQEELQKYFPKEEKNIKIFFNEISSIWEKEVLKSHYNPSAVLLMTYPFLFPRLFKYRNCTFEHFLNKFTNSAFLQEVLSVGWPYLGLRKDYVSALYMICLICAYHQDKNYFVKGGFGNIPKVLALNFEKLGGEIQYNVEVKKILLDAAKKAYGVKDTKDNSYFSAKIVSNVDSKKTFLELLAKESLNGRFTRQIDKMAMSISAFQLHIVAEAVIDQKFLSCGSISLAHIPLMLSINKLNDFGMQEQNTYVFNGIQVIENYQSWRNSFKNDNYEEIKKKFADTIIGELRKIFLIKNIKFINILTPYSFEKWLNSTDGAIYDAAALPQNMLLNRLKNEAVIKNMYLVGAKTYPGPGIAGAFLSSMCLCDTILSKKITKGRLS